MKRLILVVLAVLMPFFFTGCGFIDSGEVGVRTQFGQIQPTVEQPGFYTAILSHLTIYTAKETTVDIGGLTPRAKDNLTLKDLDVTIYYRANPAALPNFQASRAGQSAELSGEGFVRPGYVLIQNVASGVINDSVSHFDSLTLHTNRGPLESMIKAELQSRLDKDNPNTFTVTNVIVRTIHTDPSVEDAIRNSIMAEKQVQTAKQLVQVKEQEAQANEKLTQSLTPAYLQHEYNMALQACASHQGCTMIVGTGDVRPMVNVK
jgi:regulator of protease activity HflC (stomatin/prohibitin superfamily)